MKTSEKDGHVFCVDIEKSREYYKTHSLCECAYCRNYYAQIKDKLPKLGEFLDGFGVDVSKPDEIMSFETDNGINYINVDYTVCGTVEVMGKYEIDIYDSLFLSIVITDGFASPNEQTGKYFTVSVMGIELPWVLDEPLAEPIAEKLPTKIKGFFRRMFGK